MKLFNFRNLLGLVLVIFILCFSLTLYFTLTSIPNMAETDFGPADPSLTYSQRVIYSIRLLINRGQLLKTANNQTNVPFEVVSGKNALDISNDLYKIGVIDDPEALRLFLSYSGLDLRIRVGKYTLKPGMNSIEIAQMICDLNPDMVRFIILPGMRSEEIAALIPTSGLEFSTQDFFLIVKNPVGLVLRDDLKNMTTLEGLLYPGEYFFNRNTSVKDFVQTIINRFFDQITNEMLLGFQNNGLDLYKGIILASILQREGVISAERPLIASVFYNRLAQGMLLQSDPTVQYSIGNKNTGWWKTPLEKADFKIDSPYNTYLYKGLPPGPICNPDSSSLEASAFPQESNYFYFQAACDKSGNHVFATTYQEQLKNLCKQ